MFKKNDFVKLDYTGKLASGQVFDTTQEGIAKEAGLSGTREFQPVTICLGQGMLLPSLERAIEGKRSKTFTINLKAEEAFGKKDPKLLRIVPAEQLKKQGINPRPGLELNVDGNYGVVKSTGGGRTIVDFNHPLSSQDVAYDVTIIEKVDDPKEQVSALLTPLGLEPTIAVNKNSVTITTAATPPQQVMNLLQQKIITLTKLTMVSFEAGKK